MANSTDSQEFDWKFRRVPWVIAASIISYWFLIDRNECFGAYLCSAPFVTAIIRIFRDDCKSEVWNKQLKLYEIRNNIYGWPRVPILSNLVTFIYCLSTRHLKDQFQAKNTEPSFFYRAQIERTMSIKTWIPFYHSWFHVFVFEKFYLGNQVLTRKTEIVWFSVIIKLREIRIIRSPNIFSVSSVLIKWA